MERSCGRSGKIWIRYVSSKWRKLHCKRRAMDVYSICVQKVCVYGATKKKASLSLVLSFVKPITNSPDQNYVAWRYASWERRHSRTESSPRFRFSQRQLAVILFPRRFKVRERVWEGVRLLTKFGVCQVENLENFCPSPVNLPPPHFVCTPSTSPRSINQIVSTQILSTIHWSFITFR
jgi:hypothetical protein